MSPACRAWQENDNFGRGRLSRRLLSSMSSAVEQGRQLTVCARAALLPRADKSSRGGRLGASGLVLRGADHLPGGPARLQRLRAQSARRAGTQRGSLRCLPRAGAFSGLVRVLNNSCELGQSVGATHVIASYKFQIGRHFFDRSAERAGAWRSRRCDLSVLRGFLMFACAAGQDNL